MKLCVCVCVCVCVCDRLGFKLDEIHVNEYPSARVPLLLCVLCVCGSTWAWLDNIKQGLLGTGEADLDWLNQKDSFGEEFS